ncbi:Uncharacterised protein [Raoultella ornithinolytica]|nr:Uncharacterised protein [Raoultella ornithinolytica]
MLFHRPTRSSSVGIIMLRVFQNASPNTVNPTNVGSSRLESLRISGTLETISRAQMEAMPMVSSSTLSGPRRVGRAFSCAQAQRQIAKQIVHAADHYPDNQHVIVHRASLNAGLNQRGQTAADNPGENGRWNRKQNNAAQGTGQGGRHAERLFPLERGQ